MCGVLNLRLITTLRPRGPRVAFTASAKMFTPAIISERASLPNLISLFCISIFLLTVKDKVHVDSIYLQLDGIITVVFFGYIQMIDRV